VKAETFCEIFGDIQECYIAEAREERHIPKTILFKWCAAAACLSILIISLAFSYKPVSAPDAGGPSSDGRDSVLQSIAVYPADETFENVSDASLTNLEPEAAFGFDTLGTYLPKKLPEGYFLQKAALYETTMKEGTTYHMLRASFACGSPSAQESEAGAFVVFVMDFAPHTQHKIHNAEDITPELLAAQQHGVLHIAFENIYVGISDLDLPVTDSLTMIRSIGPDPSVLE